MQKLKNNEAQPKFTGSYNKKACNTWIMFYFQILFTTVSTPNKGLKLTVKF